MLLGEAMSRGTDTVLAGNIGHIPLAKRLGFTVHGDFGLNAYNSKTLSALAEMGVSRQTLSFEARLAQIRDMRGPLETDLIVYGRLPLMIFENCAIRRQQHGGKCSCQNGVTYLTDRRRERFPLLNEFGCRNTLLNSRPLCLREDFARLGVQTARLQFTIESPEECVRIARAFLSGAPLDGEFTNGLYKKRSRIMEIVLASAAAAQGALSLITEHFYGLPCRCGRNPAGCAARRGSHPSFPPQGRGCAGAAPERRVHRLDTMVKISTDCASASRRTRTKPLPCSAVCADAPTRC